MAEESNIKIKKLILLAVMLIALMVLASVLVFYQCSIESVPVKTTKIMIDGDTFSSYIIEINQEGKLTVATGENIDLEKSISENENVKVKSKNLPNKKKKLLNDMMFSVENEEYSEYGIVFGDMSISAEIDGKIYQSYYSTNGEEPNALQRLAYELIKISPLKFEKPYRYYMAD